MRNNFKLYSILDISTSALSTYTTMNQSSMKTMDSVAPGRKSTEVWDHFEKIGGKNQRTKRYHCKCKHCEQEFDGRIDIMKLHVSNECVLIPGPIRAEYLSSLASTVSAPSNTVNMSSSERKLALKITKDEGRNITKSLSCSMDSYVDHPFSKDACALINQDLLRAFVDGGVPFRFVENRFFRSFLNRLKTTYSPPSSVYMANSLLSDEYAYICNERNETIKSAGKALYCTSTMDGWSTRRMTSDISVNVTTNEGDVHLISHSNASREKHDFKYLAKVWMNALLSFFGAKLMLLVCIASDNASNMKKTRNEILKKPEFKHVLEFRCAMHAFGSTMGSYISHPFFKDFITEAQQIVTFFRASHKPLALLLSYGFENMDSKNKSLKTSNHTRITSVYICLKSILDFENSFQRVVSNHSDVFKESKSENVKQVVINLKSKSFWATLHLICCLLEPFSQVITAVQTIQCTLADVMIYWIYLSGRIEEELANDRLSNDVKDDIKDKFNKRAKEMSNNYYQLALFLHPYYKKEACTTMTVLKQLLKHAVILMANRKHSEQELEVLCAQVHDYFADDLSSLVNSETEISAKMDVKEFWKSMPRSTCNMISNLVSVLYSCVPVASSIERTFSLKGWIQNKFRNSMSDGKTHMAVSIKTHHDNNFRRSSKERAFKKRPLSGSSSSSSTSTPALVDLSNDLTEEEPQLKDGHEAKPEEEITVSERCAVNALIQMGNRMRKGEDIDESFAQQQTNFEEEDDVVDELDIVDALVNLRNVIQAEEEEEIEEESEEKAAAAAEVVNIFRVSGVDYSSAKFRNIFDSKKATAQTHNVSTATTQASSVPFSGNVDTLVNKFFRDLK